MVTGTATFTDAVTGRTATGTAGFTVAPGPLLISEGGAWFCAYPGPGNADPQSYETMAGRKLDGWYRYYEVTQSVPTTDDAALVAAGRYLIMSLAPSYAVPPAAGGITWAAITAGTYDAPVRQIGAGLAALASPSFVVWSHEPEIASMAGFGSAADFRSSFQHVASLLRAAAPGKVVMCWTSSGTTGAAYYPGDAWCDWIGIDPYDPTLAKGSPAATYTPFITWLDSDPLAAGGGAGSGGGHGKPLAIFETGVDNTVAAASAAAWISAVPACLAGLQTTWGSKFRLWQWFNSSGTLGNTSIAPGSQAAAALATTGSAALFSQPHA